jgi:hypothetical protein
MQNETGVSSPTSIAMSKPEKQTQPHRAIENVKIIIEALKINDLT